MSSPYYLMHYGIKLQKWGVRRYQNEDGTYTEEGKRRRRNNEVKADRKDALKKRRTLSDDELLERIGRLEREKKLKELTEQDIYAGRTATKKTLKEIGVNTAKTIGTAAIMYGAYYVVNKKFGSEAAAFLKPKKK